MRVFNYSEARQNFTAILNISLNEEVIITRKDGSKFKIVPIQEAESNSPFDVGGIDTNIETDEIINFIRERRENSK